MSKYGRQPAADVIIDQGLTRVQVAEAIGVPITIFNNVLAGQQVPSDEVREGLVRVLGVPLEQLFNPEPLARKVGRRYRWGSMVSEARSADEVKVQQPTKRRQQPPANPPRVCCQNPQSCGSTSCDEYMVNENGELNNDNDNDGESVSA